MRLVLNRPVERPAVVMLGTWDPFTAEEAALLGRLHDRASRHGWSSVAVMLDPLPGVFVAGALRFPVYDDFATRAALLARTGIDAVAHVEFAWDDLAGSAATFFDMLAERVPLREFWLKHEQTIGSGLDGIALAIRAEGRRHGFHVIQMGPQDYQSLASQARKHLLRGSISEAARIIGHPPTVTRPASGTVRLAWAPGPYRAMGTIGMAGAPFDVELVPCEADLGTLRWPDPRVDALSFVSGPADLPPANGPMPSFPPS